MGDLTEQPLVDRCVPRTNGEVRRCCATNSKRKRCGQEGTKFLWGAPYCSTHYVRLELTAIMELMSSERYRELLNNLAEPTEVERDAGWHFCPGAAEKIIHPMMDEARYCRCEAVCAEPR